MRKLIKYMLSISTIIFMWISLCHWAPFWVTQKDTFPFEPPEDTQCKDWSTDLWNCVIVKDDDWILKGLFSIFNIDIVKDDDHKFLNYVKAILNMALGLLSMIALVMTIYTFYLMFFTDNEAWAKKAKWNLVGIFIALAIIWLSWLIVSFIFRWYKENRQNNPQIEEWITMLNNELSNKIYFSV